VSYSLKNGNILLASHNKGKLDELHNLLDGKVANLSSALDHDLDEPEETGTTFIDNAILKAKDCLAQIQKIGHQDIICIADDRGFSVDALGCAPGVYSARWAERTGHEGRDFNYAMQRVYDEWQKTDPSNDKSAFISVIAVAFPDGHIETFDGRVTGAITWPARGEKGFGYDPIFSPDGYSETFAEMSFKQKQTMSHRAIALQKMMVALL
jgi:XTP/dITP diphosphohydrolase